MAFWQSAHTFPRVSFPSSVVRSIIEMARRSPQTLDSFFSERLASDAARSSAATASTPCAISRASAIERRNPAGGNDEACNAGTNEPLIREAKLAPRQVVRGYWL